jgi:PAS domain-containing protein
MLGLDSGRTVFDIDRWTALIHPDDRDRIAAESEAALASDATFRTEYRLRTSAGDWCHVLSSGRVCERDAQGRARRMIGAHTDVTELRRTEAELRSARDRLQGTSKNSVSRCVRRALVEAGARIEHERAALALCVCDCGR